MGRIVTLDLNNQYTDYPQDGTGAIFVAFLKQPSIPVYFSINDAKNYVNAQLIPQYHNPNGFAIIYFKTDSTINEKIDVWIGEPVTVSEIPAQYPFASISLVLDYIINAGVTKADILSIPDVQGEIIHATLSHINGQAGAGASLIPLVTIDGSALLVTDHYFDIINRYLPPGSPFNYALTKYDVTNNMYSIALKNIPFKRKAEFGFKNTHASTNYMVIIHIIIKKNP